MTLTHQTTCLARSGNVWAKRAENKLLFDAFSIYETGNLSRRYSKDFVRNPSGIEQLVKELKQQTHFGHLNF